MSTTKLYLSDGIYIPVKYVSDTHRETIEQKFERHVYVKEKTCEACEFFAERPCDTCTGCPNYKGLYKLHRDVEYKEQRCVRLPYGDRASVMKMFGADEIRVVDHTKVPEMKRSFKMTVPLRPYQEPAVNKMMAVRSGVLKSAPRTGKTVMAAAVVAKHGLKTIILASQTDWLDGFHETFVGSDTQEAMTNMKKSRIGYCRTLEDFEQYDVCLCTYQTFIREKGQRLLKKISKMFGVVVIDEIQFGAALKFSSVINSFAARYRYGLSGTPQRKDTMEFIVYKILGKVFYETDVPKMKPRLEVAVPPPIKKLPQSWTYAVGALEKSPERLKFIAETAVKDAKNGHIILIPLARVDVINALAKAINIIAGRTIAVAFTGQTTKNKKIKGNRKQLIDDLRNRRLKIMVGTFRLVSTGINIPSASMLYQVSPSSNLPNAEQRFSRVLTPMPGKQEAVFKYFLDNVQLVRSCMRAEHFGCIWPMFKPRMDSITKAKLDAYFSNSGGSAISGPAKQRKSYEDGVSNYI